MVRTELVVQFLSGVLTAGYAVAGLFFLRFWRDSRDRLFGNFSIAFFLLALQSAVIAVIVAAAAVYLVRLAAFLLILWAIIDKNRPRG